MTDETAVSPERRRWFLIGFAIIAAILAIGLWLSSRPARTPLQGEVEATEVNVASRIAGSAGMPAVEEGDRVTIGQLLLTLDVPAVDALTQQSNAALETALALQQAANTGVRPEDLASLQAVATSADAQARLASISARRADNLYAEGVIAAQRRDEARALSTSAAAQARAARLQYQKAVSGTRAETRRAADAQVALAGGGNKATAALSADREIRSPVAGEVAKRLVEPGEVIAPAIPLFQIVDIDHPWVRLAVSETQMAGLEKGKVLVGDIPALRRSAVRFVVRSVAVQGDFATKKATRQSSGFDERGFELKLSPEKPIDGLRPGMSVLFDDPR